MRRVVRQNWLLLMQCGHQLFLKKRFGICRASGHEMEWICFGYDMSYRNFMRNRRNIVYEPLFVLGSESLETRINFIVQRCTTLNFSWARRITLGSKGSFGFPEVRNPTLAARFRYPNTLPGIPGGILYNLQLF